MKILLPKFLQDSINEIKEPGIKVLIFCLLIAILWLVGTDTTNRKSMNNELHNRLIDCENDNDVMQHKLDSLTTSYYQQIYLENKRLLERERQYDSISALINLINSKR